MSDEELTTALQEVLESMSAELDDSDLETEVETAERAVARPPGRGCIRPPRARAAACRGRRCSARRRRRLDVAEVAASSLRTNLASLGAWVAPRAHIIGNPRATRDPAALLRSLKDFGAYVAQLDAPVAVPG